MGIFPKWHPLIFQLIQLINRVPLRMARIHKTAADAVSRWVQKPHCEGFQGSAMKRSKTSLQDNYVSTLLGKSQENPQKFTMDDVSYHLVPNLAAGGQTIANALTVAIYHLTLNSTVLHQLRCELKKAFSRSGGTPTWKECDSCEYLQATIKETMRVFSVTSFLMPRIVPKGGLVLADTFFPENVNTQQFNYPLHCEAYYSLGYRF
jgi:cytochrome P450